LVDRSSYPTRLTPAGQTLYEQSLEMLHSLQTTRAMLRAHNTAAGDMIEFAVPHTLAFTFFPAWLTGLRKICGPIKSRLIALNVHDAVLRLVEGNCDLLIAYHHTSQPIQLDADRYEMMPLGKEVLAPCVKPDEHGQPLYRLPGTAAHPLPYLGYAPGAYLGRVVDLILKQDGPTVHLDRVYETDMAEGLKAMALEGHGIAFLPLSAVQKERQSGKLVSAGTGREMALDIRIYRERPQPGVKSKRPAQVFWDNLSDRVANAAS
jgi:DNA-binding transcriptional LysR family regulator